MRQKSRLSCQYRLWQQLCPRTNTRRSGPSRWLFKILCTSSYLFSCLSPCLSPFHPYLTISILLSLLSLCRSPSHLYLSIYHSTFLTFTLLTSLSLYIPMGTGGIWLHLVWPGLGGHGEVPWWDGLWWQPKGGWSCVVSVCIAAAIHHYDNTVHNNIMIILNIILLFESHTQHL